VLTLRLALRAIRWRAAASAAVFAVAVVAILAATVGPIYLHAVDETVLARHLKGASAYQRDVLVSRESEIGYRVDWGAQVRRLVNGIAHDRVFARPVWEEQVDVVYGGAQPLKAEIASIDQRCVHLRIVRGRCLSGHSTGETLISTHTAAAEHLRVGDTLATSATGHIAIRLRVVGVYRPLAPGGAFWEPWDLFGFGQPPPRRGPPPGDASFVTPATLTSRLPRVRLTLAAYLKLRAGALRYDDVAGLRTTLAHARATIANFSAQSATTGAPAADMTTALPTILDETAGETSLARTLVTVTTAQLALLAMLLLYAAVASTTTAQGPEVALAKLRGRRAGSVLLQSVAQPVALVLVAAPVAALLAWLVVRLLAARTLGHDVDVAFPPAAYGVAALAVLGGVLAAVVAARRIVVTPVGALMRLGAAAPGSPIALLVADAVTVTIAVAGLIELEAGGVLDSGNPNPLSVLAPTLLAAAAAVVALRLLPLLARRLARWTRDSPRLATFLAVRQLLRRPVEARAALLVAVAVSIAAFAVATWADARHNRSLRAVNSAGAATVLIVRPGARVHDLRTAVDRADPSGHSMAVAYTGSEELPPLIAVDTARFASVAAWVAGNASTPLPSVLRTLAGGRPAPVTVTGTRLRLHVDLTRRPRRPVHVVVNLTKPDYAQAVRTVGPLAPGRGSYDVSLPSACASGCRVAALGLTADTANPYADALDAHVKEIDAVVGASIRSGGGWRPVASFGDAARWRGDGTGPVAIDPAGGSLSLHVRQTPLASTWPLAVSAAIPHVLPAVVASGRAALYPGSLIHGVVVVGLDGLPATADGVIRSHTLPQAGRLGTMVDFGAALAAMASPPSGTTRYQVWLSPAAPRDMAARLGRQHVYVQRTLHSSRYRAALDHSGPAFADSLFLASALAAILLAIGATAVARAVSVRRRGYELAALEAVGVSPRTLRRATAAEQGSVFAIGLVVGLAAGLVGSRLALPSTPVFIDASAGPPPVFGLPWALLAGLAAGLVVVFVVVSVAIARLVERAATPSQLRGAQQ
jgi:predicted lysophospholipase L1 biosynthesis ABC-type transport system permease subunit